KHGHHQRLRSDHRSACGNDQEQTGKANKDQSAMGDRVWRRHGGEREYQSAVFYRSAERWIAPAIWRDQLCELSMVRNRVGGSANRIRHALWVFAYLDRLTNQIIHFEIVSLLMILLNLGEVPAT